MADNVVDFNCNMCVFTNCDGVCPHSLVINAEIYDGTIIFEDAICDVCIPHITIGPQGELGRAIWNSQRGTAADGSYVSRYFNLLKRADSITIVGNAPAVEGLAAYVGNGCQGGYGQDE